MEIKTCENKVISEHATVSMQESTTGAITQFMELEGCECLHSNKLLSFLAGALQRYEEEGIVLHPKVLLCSSIKSFSQSLPGGRFLVIGQIELSNDAGKYILKQCATLSRAGWTVFIERNTNGIEARFGVLSFLQSPTSVELHDMVMLGRDESLGDPELAVLAEQLDPKTVFFSGSRGNTLRISFSTTRVFNDEAQALQKFSDLCCFNVDNTDFKAFFRALLERSLNESHGALLVCKSLGLITTVKCMNDAVLLDPPLDLADAFAAYKTSGDANSILELQRSEALLIGMLQSDGIVVLNDQGTITAYRVFFRETKSTRLSAGGKKKGQKTSSPMGGARRRAFEGLKNHIGEELQGVLFRSQDGVTEFKGV